MEQPGVLSIWFSSALDSSLGSALEVVLCVLAGWTPPSGWPDRPGGLELQCGEMSRFGLVVVLSSGVNHPASVGVPSAGLPRVGELS